MTLVADIQYFPSIIYFLKLSEFSNCKFEIYDRFQKKTFRNRCSVMGGNGPIQLSIPLAGGRTQKTIMKDVMLDNKTMWKMRHWKTIISCYNKSPWFDFYRDELEHLYRSNHDYLHEWNYDCIQWICDKMSIQTEFSLTSDFTFHYDENNFFDYRNSLTPSSISEEDNNHKRYPQVFEDRFGFVPNLSILDYLFCNGNKLLR